MPRDTRLRYHTAGHHGHLTIARMTRANYDHSRDTPRGAPRPYPTPSELIQRIDGPGTYWYYDRASDLHLRDYVWFTRMQAARRLDQRFDARGVSRNDRVLDWLLEIGVFDRQEPDLPDVREEMAMGYTAAVTTHLLIRIEELEEEVSYPVWLTLRSFLMLVGL